MTTTDAYLKTHKEFVGKYGDQTVVFYQVGSFFEMYAVMNDDEVEGPDIYRICDILNIQVTRKNKSIVQNSRSNPLLAGFPVPGVQKHVQALLDNNYTIVIVRQSSSGATITRNVSEIISPATHLSSPQDDAAHLMTVYVDEQQHACFAIADVTTGKVTLAGQACSCGRCGCDCGTQDIVKWLQAFAPKEVLVFGQSTTQQVDVLEGLVLVHKRWDPVFLSPAYQNSVLQKVYHGVRSMLTPIEYLDLERHPSHAVALTVLLQFVYEHNPDLVQSLQRPTMLYADKVMHLAYNSATQLNLISNHPEDRPLVSLLQARCCTALGKRLMRQWLVAPTTDPDIMQSRLDMTDKLMQQRLFAQVQTHLKKVYDLERMTRRICANVMPPCDIPNLYQSLAHSKLALEEAMMTTQTTHAIADALAALSSTLCIDMCSKYQLQDIKDNIFCVGYHPALDSSHLLISEIQAIFQAMANCISNGCRVDSNQCDGLFLCMTKRRLEQVQGTTTPTIPCTWTHPQLVEMLGTQHLQLCWQECKVSSPISSSCVRISSQRLTQLAHTLLAETQHLSEVAAAAYRQFLKAFADTHADALADVASAVACLDVYAANAANASDSSYCKPQLLVEDGQHHGGYVKAKGLRHPIIERLPSLRTEYIANDLELGQMLLYGINASGKSSLMKAVGLSVIMAQAGMYVPASEFTLRPFRHVMTRISGNDNIYRGLSSFMVEMTELRSILYKCDPYSLVLGDELCAGTEALSALAIVGAGIQYLDAKHVPFMFATHLHDLASMQGVQRVGFFHMHTEVVEHDGTCEIVYDRKLRPGIGSRLYGLEVCKGLGMPHAFMNLAEKERRMLLDIPNELVSTKKSAYNSRLFMDACGVCGGRATETHHIKYQRNANKQGFIQHVHKNHHSNLVPLCGTCHTQEHRGSLNIEGYVLTSHGIKLVYHYL